MNSLPKTVTRQRRDCDLNPGPSAPDSSTLTTRLPSHPTLCYQTSNMISINATLLLVHFLLRLNFMSLFYVYVYVLYELCFHR